jgi:serine/threonine protein kinase
MQCDGSLLWTLVEQKIDPGHESDTIAQHLESCAQCRRQLTDLGGDDAWWLEACQWLSADDEGMTRDGDHCADLELPPLPPIDLGFLDPPSHPEMLGRIGRYDVEGLLGRGGMGVVLRAYDSELHRSVAVKVLAPEWAASLQARQRFAREAQAAASVAHENVIPIYNVESDASPPFLVMRYVPGMTLEHWVRTNGPLDAATILRVTGQLAEGLAAAHRRGLVHRDIKPGNVLVGENIDRVWITDFGLARAADSMTLTRTGVIAGTPHYMSPEQAQGAAVDHRSDLFSLGCVLYFLCTGKPPFDAENTLAVLHKIVSDHAAPLATHRDDLPPSFVSLVHQLLRRSPDRRPVDCEAVIKRTGAAQTELHAGLRAKPPLDRRHRRALVVGAASVLAAILISAVSFWAPPQHQRTPSDGRDTARIAENPWSGSHATEDDISPSIAHASQQIDNAVALDTEQFRQQVVELDRQAQRLDRPSDVITLPVTDFEQAKWRREVAEIEMMIRQASQW